MKNEGRSGEGQCQRSQTLLYFPGRHRESQSLFMESLTSLLNGDLSIWGVIAMPIGVMICFGPALIVWLKEEFKSGDDDSDRRGWSPVRWGGFDRGGVWIALSRGAPTVSHSAIQAGLNQP